MINCPGSVFTNVILLPLGVAMTADSTDANVPIEPRHALQFSLRTAFIAISLAAIVFAIFHYSQMVRQDARLIQTNHCFRQIGFALKNHSCQCGHLPFPVRHADGTNFAYAEGDDPAAKELYSWRFSIIHNIASYKMDAVFDQSWNAPANTPWRTVPQPYAYDGWGNGMGDRRVPASIPTNTCAFAITGPGTAFGDGNTDKPRSLDEIDGDTILVIEVRNSGIHWMEPGDFDIQTMPKTINDSSGLGISSAYGSGFHVVFADNTVWYLRNDVPFDQLAMFFTVDGAKANDRETILGPYLPN